MNAPARLPDDAPHLLVVDDDRRIRDLLSRFLASEGYRVSTAETAADARAKLNGLSFDLLILDVMMPVLDGFATMRKLRENPSHSKLPVLAVTAYAMQGDRERILDSGFDGYLSKPIDSAALSKALDQLLIAKKSQAAGSGG